MGLGRDLVKRVFCKSKSSIAAHSGNALQERHFGALDKSRWTSVRLYLCGDELNSVIVENDSASVRSSEASVVQPQREDSGDVESCAEPKVEQCGELISKGGQNSPGTELSREEAAIIIQSAFRGFLARQYCEEIRNFGNDDDDSGGEDPSGVNEAASTEVLVDDSTEIFRICEDKIAIQHRVLHKSQSQVYRLKEGWDDSTLSSDTQRLRIQNRLEATTRRERALAYAFSQQLRICATKKKPTWSDSNMEPNSGWTWLERWMATRVPENSLVEDCWSKQLESITTDQRLAMITKRRFDISFEGKESCGSNDVPVIFEEVALPSETPSDGYHHVKNGWKSARDVSHRKTKPEYHRPPGSTKVSKRVSCKEAEEKRHKQVDAKSRGETKGNDAS